MVFNLLGNAIDSLESATKFYSKYILERKYKYLKLSIICLHNSIELFSKKVLYEKNESLIFENTSKEFLRYSKRRKDERKLSFKEYLGLKFIFRNLDVRTINYTKCIRKLKCVFKEDEFKKEYVQIMYDINKLRNNIIHFTINNTDDVYMVLEIINRCFELIIEFFYPLIEGKIEHISQKNSLKELRHDISWLLEEASELSQNIFNIWHWCFYEELHNLFEKALKDKEIVKLINKNNVTYELNRLTDDMDYVELTLDSEKDYICYETVINPYLQAIAITDICSDNGPIYAVIDLKIKGDIYIFKQPIYINFLKSNKRFWHENNKLYKKELVDKLSVESIKKLIEKIIK
ncbi:hypothetical protein [Clostridium sp. ZS2-4]|uniref:hypothetical protein n=1 Tax=Clostridium sp. ZS2-4 TaxID=2987703 RepID=UPI00227D2C1B|nr:hypothetical protein [Clostridium sp. ZS2-4]MCY6354383.1 hypothetical protein [Clostridium sp. ZS2-4]